MHDLETLFKKMFSDLQIVPNSVRVHALSCFQTCFEIAFQIALECTILASRLTKWLGGADPLPHAPLLNTKSYNRPCSMRWRSMYVVSDLKIT